MKRRRLMVGSLAFGCALFATGSLGMGGVFADDGEPGSGFGSLTLAGIGSAFRLVGLNSDGKEGEGQVPYSEATLNIGNGHALSSVLWPGGTAGNAGTTIGLLGNPACGPAGQVNPLPQPLPCPPPPGQVTEKYPTLNDPIKVEAQSNAGDPSESLDYGQGAALMSASATETDAKAEAGVAGTSVTGISTFGQSHSFGHTQLTGASAAVSDASSQLKDFSLGNGVFKIGSVQSVAHAVTNGVTSSGSAHTSVQNFTIAGIPVGVDERGVHVQKSGSSLKPAVDAVNAALANFEMKVFLTEPTHTTKGGSTTYDSGSLIFSFTQPDYAAGANNPGQVLVLGGATVTAAAGPGFNFSLPPVVTSGGLQPGTAPGGFVSGPTGTGATGGFTPGGVPQQPGVANPQLPVQFASQPLKDFQGLSWWWAVLVIGGVGWVVGVLRRLPDRLLENAGTTCPLED